MTHPIPSSAVSTDVDTAEAVHQLDGDLLADRIHSLSAMLAGALGEHEFRTSRTSPVPIEVLLEVHVLALRDGIRSGAHMTRPDSGARLLARISTSAGHAAEDLADSN